MSLRLPELSPGRASPDRSARFHEGVLDRPACTEAQGAEAEAFPAAEVLPAHLLDGDEVVILAVKPSLWFVVFRSFRWVMAMVFVVLATGWWGQVLPEAGRRVLVQAALALAAGQILLAVLQWVSRLYVLTNRRIMRLTGILNVDLFECPLTRIQHSYLSLALYERVTGTGTIGFATAGSDRVDVTWSHLNSPLEVHEKVREAIRRSNRPGNGTR